MSFESPTTPDLEQESFAEKREKLKEGFGIALCTEQKEGDSLTLEEQVERAGDLRLPSVQFDFRHRSIEEIASIEGPMGRFKEANPETVVSVHGETPRIDEIDGKYKNHDRVLEEVRVAQKLGAESFTVHPPAIGSKLFTGLPAEVQAKVVGNYCSMFMNAITEAVSNERPLTIAIENMPVKGETGSYGQTAEEILLLIKGIEANLVEKGVDPTIARGHIGMTLDINHALHGVESEQYEAVLKPWFDKLKEYVKVVHLYAPSRTNEELKKKFDIVLNLAAQHSPRARLFLESKQNTESTASVFGALKKRRLDSVK